MSIHHRILNRVLAAAALGVAVLSSAAPAAADRVTILLGSHHIGASGQFEEENPGVFYTWERERTGVSFGAYRNSYGKLSMASALSYALVGWNSGEVSAFAGVAHYPEDGRNFGSHLGGDMVGLAGVQLRQGNFLVQAIPMSQGAADGLLTFGLTFDLGR